MVRKLHSAYLLVLLLVVSCNNQQPTPFVAVQEEQEDVEAKRQLQGIWIESETEEVAFRAMGDTIYYTDSISQPAYFRIVGDSLILAGNPYPIIKQSEHVFWFQNQGGDILKLVKSETEDDTLAFATNRQPQVLMLNEVLKRDSVVFFGGERYHWYVAVNPTRYRVTKTSYNSEGVAVENVYYDNIIHISLYRGSVCLYSQDFKKQMFGNAVPPQFLEQAILGNMEYDRIDARGLHFAATLCIPEEPSCYLVETIVDFKGKMSMKLLEY